MTLSLSEKIPIGIFQNPCTGDFEFEPKNPYGDFPKSLQEITLSLNEKIPMRILRNPYRDDFEFERKNPYRDFPK